MNIGKLKKWMVTGIVVLLIIAMGTALGYFTAMAIARYNTQTANLVTSIQNTDGVRLNVSVNDDEYFYPGQGREIQYSVKNQGITASDNKDVMVFTFTDPAGNPIAVSKDDAPVQLYRAEDVVLDSETMEYTIKEGAAPITIKYSAGNTLTYEFEYSLDGNNDLEEFQEVGIGTDTNTQNFVLIFDSEFADASDFTEATITMNLSTSSKIYDRWLTVWDDQETYSTSTIMNVKNADDYWVCVVYSTDGTYIGKYKTLKKGFEVAEETALADAANTDNVHVRVEMLVDGYKVKAPITLTTPYLITLSSNEEAMADLNIAPKFELINNCPGAMITVPEGSALRLENIAINGNQVEGNIVGNYGTLYTTEVSELYNTAAPAIYNGTSGVIYTDGCNIYDCASDLGAAIYSCGKIYMSGNNKIDGSKNTDGTMPSNIYLATEEAAIWVQEGFDMQSDVHVSAAVFFDKTMVYTLDPNRYNSNYTANFTFERQDILDVAGYETFYYDAEFYMDKPFQFVFDDEKMVYYPTSDNRVSNTRENTSMPRLANWSAYMLKDGTPCDADTPGAYKMEAIYGNYNMVAYTSCLREVWIPETVTTVEANAFKNCDNLSRVYWLPESVSTYEIWGGYFADCDNLKIATTQLGCTPTNGDQPNTIYMNPLWDNIPTFMFSQMPALEKLDLTGSSITTISDAAVEYSTALKEIILTDEVKTIGKNAFRGCTSLQAFNCTETLESIGAYAFQDCDSMKTAYIGSAVSNIGEKAFADCDNLTKVYWNTSMKNSGGQLFMGSDKLMYVSGDDINNAIVVGENVTYLANSMGYNASIKSIDLTNTNVATIGTQAFRNCDELTSVITGSNMRTISESAFQDCDKLTTANIQSGTTYIGQTAFYGCDKLVNLNLPDTLQQIWANAFADCVSLETVTIPESLVSIDNGVFGGCTKLSKVYWNAVNATASGNSPFLSGRAIFQNCPIKYVTTEDKNNAVIIGSSVVELPAGAFAQIPMLTDVELTDSNIKKFSSYCFYNDTALVNVAFPNGITHIGDNCFNQCVAITEVTIPESVQEVGVVAFGNCTNLAKVYWNATETTQSHRSANTSPVFQNCNKLTTVGTGADNSIVLGTNVTSLQWGLFASMANLTSVDFTGTQITEILKYLCYNSQKLSNVVISEGMKTIGEAAFRQCFGITEITIPSTITGVDKLAFMQCNNLSKVYWNAASTTALQNDSWGGAPFAQCGKLTSIGTAEDCSIAIGADVVKLQDGLFAQMSALTSVDFSETNITAVPMYCFYTDAALVNVNLGNKITTLSEGAFRQCSNLAEITVPESVTSVGILTFYSCPKLAKVYWNANATIYGAKPWLSTVFGNQSNSLYYITTEDIDNAIVIGANVNTLPGSLFAQMNALTTVNLNGANITTIPEYLFFNCPNLNSVTLPKDIASMGAQAFWQCGKLTSMVIDTQSLAVQNNTFANNFTIYCTGPEGCITGINTAWTIHYGCLSSTDLTVDEDGVVQALVGERWNGNTIDLSATNYIDDNGNLVVITGFNPDILSGFEAKSLVLPAFYTGDKFDMALLTNCPTLKTVTFNGTGYDNMLADIYANTNVQTIVYNGITTQRPIAGYTLDENGLITAVDAAVVNGTAWTLPEEIWAATTDGGVMKATGIASGAFSALSATNIIIPSSYKTVAVDAFPAGLTELTILHTGVNTEEFRAALFAQYAGLTVIHGAVADFTMLESVTSSGSNWLDTGIIGSSKLDVETSYIQHQNGNAYQSIFGGRTNPSSNTFGFFGVYAGAYGNTKAYAWRTAEIRANLTASFLDVEQHFKTNGKYAYLTIDGNTTTFTGSDGDFTAPCNIYLWAMNQNGNVMDYGKVTMHYFKMWEDDVLVRDFVPALDTNGVVCMYDRVTKTFFYCNTGELVAGAVSTESNPNYTMQDYTR